MITSRLLPVIALLSAIGIFFGYIRTEWVGEIATTKAAILHYDNAIAAADEYKKQQNELASERNKIDPTKLERLSIFLPDSVDNVGIILDLNAIAARSGLSISDIGVTTNAGESTETISPSGVPVPETNPVSFVDMSISAIGTYSALENFLMEVEKSQRLLDVRDISVTGSDTGVYNYKMAVRLYWLH